MIHAPTFGEHIYSPVTAKKILTLDDVRKLGGRDDITRVLNVGSYDFPQHLGHTNALEFSKHFKSLIEKFPEYAGLLGDFGRVDPVNTFLLVAMNSDASYDLLNDKYLVERGHGKIASHKEGERARQIANLEVVDGVVLFDEERALEVMQLYRPHVFTKGGDYVLDPKHADAEHPAIDQEEREMVEGMGGIVALMPVGVDKNGDAYHSYHHIRTLAQTHGFLDKGLAGKDGK